MVGGSFVFVGLLDEFPRATPMSSWIWGVGPAGILLMAAIAIYVFYNSLGGAGRFGEVACSRSD